MLILAGQGNPGPAYAGNRHNIGFRAVDAIAARWGFGPERSRFQGLAREGVIDTPAGAMKALILKPQTFYNESGRSVAAALKSDFRRARLGVGHPGHKDRVHGYVLSDFHKTETGWVSDMLEAVADAAPLLAAGEDERYQAEVMRLAPAEKLDPRRSGDPA